ncbi:MAG TPA: YqgE/AlgH family protein [Burkholderiales bacterium]|jgi:putative transcriptional regulator|nr:YqgE/AlgH family protein [Burkholderiales bacterium]
MPDLKLALLRALVASSAVFFLPAAGAAAPEETMLLVAKRQFQDPVYGSTIILAKPADGGGHVGFIVNKPTKMTLAELFPEHAPSKKVADPLFLGGTSDINLVFALVEGHASKKAGSFRIAPDLFLAYETKAVDRIIESESDHARFFLGLVVWRPGQLEDELDRGLWYVQEPEAKLVLRKNTDNLWEELVRRAEEQANTI